MNPRSRGEPTREELEHVVAVVRENLGRLAAKWTGIKRLIEYELDRGYVLTAEPGAGGAWRARWNKLLAETETAVDEVVSAHRETRGERIISQLGASPSEPEGASRSTTPFEIR